MDPSPPRPATLIGGAGMSEMRDARCEKKMETGERDWNQRFGYAVRTEQPCSKFSLLVACRESGTVIPI